jgi:hypothetical protein
MNLPIPVPTSNARFVVSVVVLEFAERKSHIQHYLNNNLKFTRKFTYKVVNISSYGSPDLFTRK